MSDKRTAADYAYFGPYNETVFGAAYADQFAKVPKFNQPSIPDLLFVLKKVGADHGSTTFVGPPTCSQRLTSKAVTR